MLNNKLLPPLANDTSFDSNAKHQASKAMGDLDDPVITTNSLQGDNLGALLNLRQKSTELDSKAFFSRAAAKHRTTLLLSSMEFHSGIKSIQ